MSYDQTKIEPKWTRIWEKNQTFRVDLKKAKNPFYNLAMFPYPSGEGLHVGHIIPYSGVDTLGRFLRMRGLDVFEPMGFDAFGIHSENFAIKQGLHPKTLIAKTTEYFREKQMKRLGTLFDWEREVNTTDPNYYKWTQWIFVQMFKHGLAEKRKAPVTYCPSCKTVLSDEQTEIKNGVTVCERCKTPIERRELEQWFFKITDYAERLLRNLDRLAKNAWGKDKQVPDKDQKQGINWSEKTKRAQRNWIGKQTGVEIDFSDKITVFTKFPETIFGVTYVVLAPEHPLAPKLTTPGQKTAVEEYLKTVQGKSEQERIAEGKTKTGVFTGSNIVNPVNKEKVPVWIADYVLASYGTGAVMGVPAHDERDFAFARKYNLPIIRVVGNIKDDLSEVSEISDVIEKGFLVNSREFNGLPVPGLGKEKIIDWMVKNKFARRTTTYKLRDWCISRQRYWGPPIPMIHCKECARSTSSGQGWQPVPEKDLPVVLPFIEDYQPTGDGKSPLAKKSDWVKVKCPKCGAWAERETDVSDTFLDSAWYFLRYPSVGLTDNKPWDNAVTQKWLPVDIYIGGNEHAVLHLMYARFITMALKDMGFIDFEEPFKRFFAHGLLIKEGAKMSKSRGNVVNPNQYIDKYGADTLRMYILFLGPYEAGGDFRDTAITGMHRFLNRIWTLMNNYPNLIITSKELSQKLEAVKHKTVKKVTEDVSSLQFNTAIASLMEYYNFLARVVTKELPNQPKANKLKLSCAEWDSALKIFILLLAPFAPFISEELWEKIGKGSVHDQPWPEYDESLLKEQEVTMVVQINGKVKDKVLFSSQIARVQKEVERVVVNRPKVKSVLENKKIVKTIFVPGKLINLVI